MSYFFFITTFAVCAAISSPDGIVRVTEKPSGTEISLDDLLVILSSDTYPDLIVSDYLPGTEYTVDVFAGENVKLAVPRIRTQIRSGVSFLTEIDMRKDGVTVIWGVTKPIELTI